MQFPMAVSALLAVALFAVSVGGTYIYDDVRIVHDDPRLHDPALWGRYWTQSYNSNVDNLYRPAVSMSYAIQWFIHGDRPWAFHLVNVLLHGFVSALVAELGRRLMGLAAGIIAGLLFAAHPIHVEAVANIVGRAELMCAAGFIGALILFLKPMTPARAVAIAGCFLLTVLSKEQGMLLPPLLLVLGLLRYRLASTKQAESATPQRRGMLVLVLLLAWMLAGYIVWRESILPFWWDRRFLDWTANPMVANDQHPFGGSVGRDRWLMPLALLGRYVALLVAPVRLSPDYGATIIGWSVKLDDPYLWIGAAAIIGWAILLGAALRRRWAAGAFAAIALALLYGMIGNIVALIGTNFAERLMYIPSAFALLLVAAALARLPLKAMVVTTTIVLLLASARTLTYAARWNDATVFYETSLRQQPRSIRLHMLLARQYMLQGRLEDAAQVAAAGRELLPRYPDIWMQSGAIAIERHRFDEARFYLNRAMDLRPSATIQGWFIELDKRRASATTQSGDR